MNTRFVFVLLTMSVFTACSSSLTRPVGADEVRSKFTRLQTDPHYAGRAPVAMNEAEAAVLAAEEPRKKSQAVLGTHLVAMANTRVDLAQAQAQTLYLEEQRAGLKRDSDRSRLDARTQEADTVRAENQDLQRQLADLNAKTTDRGLVVTLGDVLFSSGQANLLPTAHVNLAKLAAFLDMYPNRSLAIEGHTDSQGSDDYNLGLSQRRADAVRNYLLHHRVSSARLTSTGMGETSPVGDNATANGRRSNRRVEVIIANPTSP